MIDEHDVIFLDDGSYRPSSPPTDEMRRRLEQYRQLGQHLEGLERRLAMLRTARASYQAALKQALPERRFFWLSLGRLSAAEWSTPTRLQWHSDRVRPGDVLMVYVGGQGAPGMIEATERGYRWLARAPRLSGAIGAAELRQTFGLSHPTRQVTRLEGAGVEALYREMKARWSRADG